MGVDLAVFQSRFSSHRVFLGEGSEGNRAGERKGLEELPFIR
jgi:hypothetical protein